MAKSQPIGYRIFVGGRPYEELTAKEREEFSNRAVERMGRALNDYFSTHIDVYQKVVGSLPEADHGTERG